MAQENEEQLGSVVSSLKQLYGLRYIYCWHGLSAYWSGVSPDPKEHGVAKYKASLHYSEVIPPDSLLSLKACIGCSCPSRNLNMFDGAGGLEGRFCAALCCFVRSRLRHRDSQPQPQSWRALHDKQAW